MRFFKRRECQKCTSGEWLQRGMRRLSEVMKTAVSWSSGSFTTVYICQNSLNGTHKIVDFYCMLCYTSVTLVSKKCVCHERQFFVKSKGSRWKDTKEVCQVGVMYGLWLDTESSQTGNVNMDYVLNWTVPMLNVFLFKVCSFSCAYVGECPFFSRCIFRYLGVTYNVCSLVSKVQKKAHMSVEERPGDKQIKAKSTGTLLPWRVVEK